VPVKALLPGRKGKRDRRVEDLDEKLTGESQEIFGDQTSGPAQTMRAEIERVARRPHNVLITGETGDCPPLRVRVESKRHEDRKSGTLEKR